MGSTSAIVAGAMRASSTATTGLNCATAGVQGEVSEPFIAAAAAAAATAL